MFYGYMLLVAVVFFFMGLWFPLAWVVTGLCLVLMLIGNKAETMQEEMVAAKGEPLNVVEKSVGCGGFALLGILAGAAACALLIGLGR